MATAPINLGFLVVSQENGGWFGGYFVTNVWGRPLDFRISSAVQPNKVQQILYGATLLPYICGDLIGKTLVEKTGIPVGLILTTCEHALDMRLKMETPVAWVAGVDDKRAAIALPNGKGSLVCHPSKPQDVDAVREIIANLESGFDLVEPFSRAREAAGEARKMGVVNRAA
jgi:hypothetical protein